VVLRVGGSRPLFHPRKNAEKQQIKRLAEMQASFVLCKIRKIKLLLAANV
jgi:hypothetical protein